MCYLGNEMLSEGQSILNGDLPKEERQDLQRAQQLVVDAVGWYKAAATAGLGAAAYNLGVLYYDGVRSAAIQNVTPMNKPPASTSYVVPVDYKASLEYFKLAAELKEPAAVLWLGYCHSTAEGGVEEIDVTQVRTVAGRGECIL